MKKIDLQKIIDGESLTTKNVAEQLFPKTKYPNMALSRILKGLAVLDANQITKLSEMTKLTISQLFDYPNGWVGKPINGREMVLESKGYKATLDMDTFVVTIEGKDTLFCEQAIIPKALPVSEFTEFLDNQILKFKNG